MLMDMSWLGCLTKHTLTIVTFFHARLISVKKQTNKNLFGKHAAVFLLLFVAFLGKEEYRVA